MVGKSNGLLLGEKRKLFNISENMNGLVSFAIAFRQRSLFPCWMQYWNIDVLLSNIERCCLFDRIFNPKMYMSLLVAFREQLVIKKIKLLYSQF